MRLSLIDIKDQLLDWEKSGRPGGILFCVLKSKSWIRLRSGRPGGYKCLTNFSNYRTLLLVFLLHVFFCLSLSGSGRPG